MATNETTLVVSSSLIFHVNACNVLEVRIDFIS